MGAGTPPRLSPLVGREAELGRLDALASGGARLITLVGPPGIGKTRLAAAHLDAVRLGSETAWIALGTATRSEDVCGHLAGALQLRLSWVDPADLARELGWAIAGRDAPWLFFDEAERCVDALARLLPEWLATAPDARAVVTSRERLRVAGEAVIDVGPLASSGERPAEVLASPAGRLLLERASVEHGDVEDRDQDAEALATLVRALEGVPLAIELAAARLSLLGPAGLLARLPEGLSVLDARPMRGRASLRESLEASWALLEPIERRALACCAHFRSPFTVDAAEAVIAEDGALSALGGLRDKSLLARDVGRENGGTSRLRLYASIRAFAIDRSRELGIEEAARERYVAACAGLAADHERRWTERGDPDALRVLVAMTDDLRAAFEDAGGADRARLALGLAAVFGTRGPQADALGFLARCDGEPAIDPTLAAQVALAHARALGVIGRVDEALERLDDAARGSADDAALGARVETARAETELSRGELEASRAAIGRALVLAPARSEARVEALRIRGLTAHASGRLDEAFSSYDEARGAALELGLTRRAATLRADLATVRLQQHRLTEARELFGAARTELDPEADGVALGLAEGNLAILEQERGRLDDADALFRAGIERLRRVGHRLFAAHLLGYAGALAHERGRPEEAVARYAAALSTLRAVGDARLTAVVASLLGAAEASRDRRDAARDAFDEAERALAKVDDPGVARAVAIHRGHLDLADARAGRCTAEDARARAAARIDEPPSDDAPAPRSDDVRLALRLLRAALGLGALGIDRQGRGLTLPDGRAVDLSTRAVLWRLFEAFADRRRDAPGEALSADALIDAGWPGERLTGASGTNRLKVALSTLRKLGLRELLMRADDGYLLDPDVPLVDDEAPGRARS